MDNVLSERPEMTPLSVFLSLRGLLPAVAEGEGNSEDEGAAAAEPSEKRKRRKVLPPEWISDIVKSQGKKRHKEKIILMDRMVNVMEKIADKM